MLTASILTRLEILQMIRPKIITQVIELDTSGHKFGMVYSPGVKEFSGLTEFRRFVVEGGLETNERTYTTLWKTKDKDEFIWKPVDGQIVYWAPALTLA